jgi:hypothetical protein
MIEELNSKQNFRLHRDTNGVVRELLHFDRPVQARAQSPRQAAEEYLENYSRVYEISADQLKNLSLHAGETITNAGIEYRFLEEKTNFDLATVAFQQTYFGLPVWNSGLSVHVKQNPSRVMSSVFTADPKIEVKRPSRAAIEKFAKLTPRNLATLIGVGNDSKTPRIKRRRLIVFKYLEAKRTSDEVRRDRQRDELAGELRPTDRKVPEMNFEPTLPLPPVPDSIADGNYYVAVEVIFDFPLPSGRAATWRAIIEIETGAVLYLRPLIDNVDGLLFVADPITLSGNAGNSPAANSATLDLLRSSVPLPGLTPPAAGANQALLGEFIQISDFELATAAPPTEAPGTNFSYVSRTNNFAAVNAYYLCDRFFRLVEGMGFARAVYFDGTTFPIPVDHRGRYGSTNGIERNASCSGNGAGGIANVDFELADLTDTTNPIGIAADWRVVLHELGGHGILYDHVNSANFGFAHSSGDGFGAILNDPTTLAADRFETFPWVSFIGRRHDRAVGAGWAWGGSNDSGGYSSEQILCTTNFRTYRSLGGDSTSQSMREFAARYTIYLMLGAVGTLTPATNPTNASGYATAMITADQADWTSEGHAGGAYGKVIRWAFEKQGLYQPAGAPLPPNVTTAGAPPPVDVYIDDGRQGEYQFQPNHWSCQSIWNRRNNDAGTIHEEPIVGVTNYAYVKIKNRGTLTATDVVVKGYHCNPSTGLIWPDDWQPMSTAQLSAPNVAPNSSVELTVGPFEWIPSQLDHECMLMIVSATGDASNIDNFSAGDTIPEWRLVPHDNNIGQRNVFPVAAGGGLKGLIQSMADRRFIVGNPNPGRARIQLVARLPKLLVDLGWELVFTSPGSQTFSLNQGQTREVTVSLKGGRDFSAADVEALREEDRAINVEAYADGILTGGVSYALDTSLKVRPLRFPPGGPGVGKCNDRAEQLLDCLGLPSHNVKSAKVRRITIEIELDDDCDGK